MTIPRAAKAWIALTFVYLLVPLKVRKPCFDVSFRYDNNHPVVLRTSRNAPLVALLIQLPFPEIDLMDVCIYDHYEVGI